MAHLSFHRLFDYLECRLDQPAQIQVDAHLSTCRECQDKLKAIRFLLKEMFRAYLAPSAASLPQSVHAAIHPIQHWFQTHLARLPIQRYSQRRSQGNACAPTAIHHFLGTFERFDVQIQIAADSEHANRLSVRGRILPTRMYEECVDGVHIQICLPKGKRQCAITDPMGRFSFEPLSPGSYLLLGALGEFDFLIAPLLVQ